MVRKIKYLILFSFILLLGLCTKSQARITTTDPTVESGGTVTITINSQEKVASGAIDITSNDGLTFVSVSGGQANGTLVAFAGSENKTSGIATYTFKAPKVTKTQTYQVVFTSQDMEDVDGNAIASSSGTATVTVTAPKSNEEEPTPPKEDEKPVEPSFEKVEQTVYATTRVNVRSSYSTDSSIVGSLDEGESVTRTGIGSNGWSKVTYNGYTAYVSSDYLTTTKPEVKPTDQDNEDNKNDEKEDNDKEDNNKDDEKEEKSNNNNLKILNIAPAGLEPKFDPNIVEYTLHVGTNIDNLLMEIEADDEKATAKIVGNKDFKIGENTVKVVVTAEDGTEKEYVINVIKEEIAQLGLKELLIEGLEVTPEFSEEIYEYTLKIEKEGITELNITATASRENAKVEIIGNTDLKPGENVITILVTDGEGEQQETITYQITVTLPEILQQPNLILGLQEDEFYKDVAIVIAIIVVIIIIIIMLVKNKKRRKEDNDYLDLDDEDREDIVDANKEIEKLTEDELPKSLRKEPVKLEEEIKTEKTEYLKDDERKNKLDAFTSAVDEDDIYNRRKKGKHF